MDLGLRIKEKRQGLIVEKRLGKETGLRQKDGVKAKKQGLGQRARIEVHSHRLRHGVIVSLKKEQRQGMQSRSDCKAAALRPHGAAIGPLF
jgi:hypothetical protein